MWMLGWTIAVILLDQWTKHMAVMALQGGSAVSVLGKWLQWDYVENRGAAFGMLQNRQVLFFVITAFVCVFILTYLWKHRHEDRVKRFALALILGGGLGNFIDRVLHQYVVDFIRVDIVPFYQFPIFNVADIAVTVGVLVLLIDLIFFEKHRRGGQI